MTRELVIAQRMGFVAGGLGGVAGIAQLLAGTTPWTGNKNDPMTLGVVTLCLAAVLGLTALAATRATTTDRGLAVAATFLLAALLGLTTAGPAWLPAALAGLIAGGLAGRSAARAGSVGAAIGHNWLPMLLVVLAIVYLALGMTAMGPAGVLGIAGGIAVLGALVVRARSRSLAIALLVVGAVPFAVVTSWSLVTPLTGILLIAIGLPTLLASSGRWPVVRSRVRPDTTSQSA